MWPEHSPWGRFFLMLTGAAVTYGILFFLFAIIVFGLGGCAPDRQFIAPSLVDYSAEFQKAAGEELNATKSTAPHLAQMIVDYGKLRAAIRAVTLGRASTVSASPASSGPAPVAPDAGAGHFRQQLPIGD